MSAIAGRFASLRDRGEKALVPFVTGGDPPIEHLPMILRTLESGGADLIEVGLPFSDPIADGPTIQASSQRSLDRGTRLEDIFEAVAKASVGVPVIYMGYTNVALRRGFGRFAKGARESGAAGALLSDLTPEEAGDWQAAAKEAGLDTVFLVAPTSTNARIELACGATTGFVYCVSRTGVTGAENRVPADVRETVARVKRHTSLPVCVGFGISQPEHVRMVCEVADGAVVGSHLVNLLAETWREGSGREKLQEAVAGLKAASRI
ncbi:MAG: tryptophan synthase subunit alpha [Armatimonadetes bacterium]|nr:tryptophan synthase subunit alpha [Armatimonadota bacterium]